ncbi:MAG: 1-acyl-sn-glycerol-3-phosphate acyltransferase [Saprospirales bacterium]|nr:1-acyl-sn-glycerol-3-phosphate acyltransferase [Saprospirales bacterium]
MKKEKIEPYPHVIPDIKDWPIYHLHQKRKQFVKEIGDFASARIQEKYGKSLGDTIAKAVYMERIRIKEEPWKVDPQDERLFWLKIQKKLARLPQGAMPEEEIHSAQLILLKKIIHRYSEEIVGSFRISTFQFARRFTTFFFNRLLNTAASRNLRRLYGSRYQLHERLIAKGEVDKVRSLITKGTVVMVPTHFSNLDSILIGYVMDAVVGLPSFHYGAGLNLYNYSTAAYFMNRLGSYRLDRRKKNSIYLEVLKAMSTLAIQKGTNTLFFPGGTRSRAGAMESKLKMGLLGTVVEAQRLNLEAGKEDKIFIVPVVLGYHVVLEAEELIEQHLRRTGKERYIRNKEGIRAVFRALSFAWKVFSQSSEITVSFGKPMDILGNFVDEEGKSYDRFGKEVLLKDYFMSGGNITEDLQRESQYTKILANRIVERYYKENIVLSSHLVAFAAFEMLKRANYKLDLFALLRLPTDDLQISLGDMETCISFLQAELVERESKGNIKLSEQIRWAPRDLIMDGIKNLGVFNAFKPLKINKKNKLVSQDFKLLFYYRNRLENYKLEEAMEPFFQTWQGIPELSEEERIEEIGEEHNT